MSDPKQELRDRIRAERLALTPATVLERSEAVMDKLDTMTANMVGSVCAGYLALPGEVLVDDFLADWLGGAGRVCVPKFRPDKALYEMVWLDALEQVTVGMYGVREPSGDATAWLYEVDFILVPGVAFDAKGGRLGRGGGYYDRLLAGIAAPKIGLAFDFQIVDSVPLTEQDIRMDALVTETQALWFDSGTS